MDLENLCYGCMENRNASKTCSHCGLPAGTGPESALHLPPGTILQDKYLLGRALGQGGFGITYLAWDLNLKLNLAIKEFLPQQLAYRTDGRTKISVYKKSLAAEFIYGREKFLEEAQTLARFIEHPNVVSVRDYFEANGTAYLVMQYHEGFTLQNYLTRKGRVIPVRQAFSIFMPVLDALRGVHAVGILHRDISPDNLLIEKKGRVVLIDFGAARQAMGEKSKSLSVIMKAGFSPPEQYQSRGKQGPWTDIYAVAATMYWTITGKTPLESIDRMAEDDLKRPSQIGIAIEPRQERALLKALSVKASDRFQTVEAFQKELVASLAKSQPLDVYDDSRVEMRKTSVPPPPDLSKLKKQADLHGPSELISSNNIQVNTGQGNKKIWLTIATVSAVLIIAAISFFMWGENKSPAISSPDKESAIDIEPPEISSPDKDSAVGTASSETDLNNILSEDDIIEAFISAGLPIQNVVVYNLETCPNNLLGRPGQYIGKASWEDARTEKYDTFFSGGTVEVFANKKDLNNRKNYLEESPFTALVPLKQYVYVYNNALIRIDFDLTPEEAEEYRKALSP